MLVTGELTGFKRSRVQAFFELRDSQGALPCSIWNSDLDRLGLDPQLLADGAEVVIGGGLDYYPGSANASPSFNFRVTHMRLAGEGDLLGPARSACARSFGADGLFEPQKQLARPLLPKTIGVVTARGSAACQDLLAGLERRGWRGTHRLGRRAGAGPPRGAARSRARCAGSPSSSGSRSPWSAAAAARSPTSGRSATRTSAGPSRCFACR